ncbi:MAG: ferrous iron transport protein B, partial [Anaerolineae bacterium]|nr:ferrous iron transport protein B [Anaerolineae bacterium]
VVLNMADMARKRGIQIDAAQISVRLGSTPVIQTTGSRNEGLDALKAAITNLATGDDMPAAPDINYGATLETEIAALQTEIANDPILSNQFSPRWLAIKLLESDEDLHARLEGAGYHDLIVATEAAMDRIADATDEDSETLITDRRYQFITTLLHGAVIRKEQGHATRTDQADQIITHPVWGVPIFLLLMWIVFQLTANVSAPYLDWIDATISGPITRWSLAILEAVSLDGSWVEALIVDGVIAGVGGVLVFVPVLFFLYFAVAVLEDTGYMARSAFVMDRGMRLIGLHGKSFLPLMIGFGCNVPAIYATRTLEDEQDRKLTGFLTTFMSCGARLPVYVVFGTAFFGAKSGNLIFGMYLLGIAVALITGIVMKRTIFRNKEPQPFVLELPPYRAPNLRNVMTQVRQRTADFLRNAATIILACSLVIWFLLAIPVHSDNGSFNDVRTEDSVFGEVSRLIAPALDPAGFGSWEAAGSLITGFVAKEAVVSTMNQIYVEEADGNRNAGNLDVPAEAADPTFVEDTRDLVTSFGEATILTVQETVNILPRTVNLVPGVNIPEADWLGSDDEDDTTDLERALTTAFAAVAGSKTKGDLAAVAFNVFVLLYIPCMASVAAMRHEFGWRWMTAQIVYTLALAWLAAVIVYQGGLLLGLT